MLLLALALQAVSMPPKAAPHVRTPRRATRIRLAAKPVGLVFDCRRSVYCARTQTNRYRLVDSSDPVIDLKQDALHGPWQNCGTTGMPVCASKGRQIFRTTLGD